MDSEMCRSKWTKQFVPAHVRKNTIEKPLNKGHRGPFSIILVHFDLQREDNLSIKEKWLVPMCPLFRGSTVYLTINLIINSYIHVTECQWVIQTQNEDISNVVSTSREGEEKEKRRWRRRKGVMDDSGEPHQPELRGQSLWVSWWVSPTSLAPTLSPPATPGESAGLCHLCLLDTPSWEPALDCRLCRWEGKFQKWSIWPQLSEVSWDAATEAELEDLRQQQVVQDL